MNSHKIGEKEMFKILLSIDVQNYLQIYLCNVVYSLQKYVREQILLAVAVIVKRGSLDKSIDCKSIFHEVSQLISSGNPTVVSTSVFSSKVKQSVSAAYVIYLVAIKYFIVRLSS